ncbi:MAG: BON domain-containing protein [Candidatus Binatia bacterium]
MKYCPICRREYVDSDQSCVEHGMLKAGDSQLSAQCELCGRIVEREEVACRNCGAKINIRGWAGESFDRSSRMTSEEEPAKPSWLSSDDEETLPEFFRFSDSRPAVSTGKRTGVVLTVAGFAAGISVSFMVMRNVYDSKPAAVAPVQQPEHAPPRVENLLPHELPGSQSKTLPDKSIENFTNESIETEALPAEVPLKPAGSEGSGAIERPRRAVQPDHTGNEKRRVAEKSTAVSLKIPSGVRIPSPAELRRKKAQHEMEQAAQGRAIPGDVNIPSPIELRRKRVEHEIEQAIQIRAIEGVSVSVIGSTVYLTGQVETERQRAAAEKAARGIPEVRNVRSSISVRWTKG